MEPTTNTKNREKNSENTTRVVACIAVTLGITAKGYSIPCKMS